MKSSESEWQEWNAEVILQLDMISKQTSRIRRLFKEGWQLPPGKAQGVVWGCNKLSDELEEAFESISSAKRKEESA